MRNTTRDGGPKGVLLAACCLGLFGGGGCGNAADCDGVTRGCVDLMNFSTSPASIAVGNVGTVVVSSARFEGGSLVAGASSVRVASSQGEQTTFDLIEGGTVARSATCTVGPDAWISVNPALVVQQTRTVSCSGW